jgi:oxygen-independent coproporphyrinogen-3 oxidase
MAIGLYIHVPFCRARCEFCAFYLQIHRPDRAALYLQAVSREIRLHGALGTAGGRPLETVYFGGGTPMTLEPGQLADLLRQVQETFGIRPGAEITVEAHPDTVTAEALRQLAQAGVNRLSVGVQALEAQTLVQIGRRGGGRSARAVVAMARDAGILNVNLDLIYGLPGQSLEAWARTLDAVLELEPSHLSCYALTIEEHSALHVSLRRGACEPPDADLQNAMAHEASIRLAEAGFEQYELSNFSRPGFASRHNLLYWNGEDYLGIGPSAQSYVDGRRFGTVANLATYASELASGRLPLSEDLRLTPAQRARESVVFGLRLTAGIDRRKVQEADLGRDWQRGLDRLIAEGWLEESGTRLRLTEAGRRFADSVAVELF